MHTIPVNLRQRKRMMVHKNWNCFESFFFRYFIIFVQQNNETAQQNDNFIAGFFQKKISLQIYWNYKIGKICEICAFRQKKLKDWKWPIKMLEICKDMFLCLSHCVRINLLKKYELLFIFIKYLKFSE